MKKTTIIVFSVYSFFSVIGCSQSVSNQQATANMSSIEKENVTTNVKDTIIAGLATWYAGLKDTIVKIGNKQIYAKIEIVEIQEEFVVQKSYGDYGKEYISKIPNTEINIQISNNQYKLQKQDIPNLDNNFLKKSVFQRIFIRSITEKTSVFEIRLGELDTDDIVTVFLAIDTNGNKSFKIEYR